MKWWYYWIVTILILVATLVWESNKTDLRRYIGETVITPEQYVEIVSKEDGMSKNDTFIIDGESYNLTFDFFSEEEYDYLNKAPRSFDNNLVVVRLRQAFTKPPLLITIPLFILFFVVYYFVVNKRGKVYQWSTIFTHYLERQRDKQIPLTANVNIVINPTDIKMEEISGIATVRSWKVDKKGELKSIVQNTKWESADKIADEKPDKDGVKGIYGYRLGASIKQFGTVMGVVELNGNYQYHAEGIVRAEHCRMLGFFMSKGLERTARFISNKYGVPVYLDDTPEVAYLGWLYSGQGLKALQHNYELLKGG